MMNEAEKEAYRSGYLRGGATMYEVFWQVLRDKFGEGLTKELSSDVVRMLNKLFESRKEPSVNEVN